MSERRAHGSIRFAVIFFIASAVFPSLSRAQVPVFKTTTEDSSIKIRREDIGSQKRCFRQVGRATARWVMMRGTVVRPTVNRGGGKEAHCRA